MLTEENVKPEEKCSPRLWALAMTPTKEEAAILPRRNPIPSGLLLQLLGPQPCPR